MKFILDIASAAIEGADRFIENRSAPGQYTKPDSIAKWQAEDREERIARAGLDMDLARVSAIAWQEDAQTEPNVLLCLTEDDERHALKVIAPFFRSNVDRAITYGGHRFDLPLLMRRAKYLGVAFPIINLDRYRSPHHDLCMDLSDRDPSRMRPLGFYVKRLGWTDLTKPLDGASEAQVFQTGDWDGLTASLRHDIEATRRLAMWTGALPAHDWNADEVTA